MEYSKTLYKPNLDPIKAIKDVFLKNFVFLNIYVWYFVTRYPES